MEKWPFYGYPEIHDELERYIISREHSLVDTDHHRDGRRSEYH